MVRLFYLPGWYRHWRRQKIDLSFFAMKDRKRARVTEDKSSLKEVKEGPLGRAAICEDLSPEAKARSKTS